MCIEVEQKIYVARAVWAWTARAVCLFFGVGELSVCVLWQPISLSTGRFLK
jgi:hypothetical protein